MLKKADRPDLDQIARMGARCTLGHLRMATRVVTKIYDDILRPSGLRSTQFGVLAATGLFGPATVSRLADLTVMDRTTLTRNLKPLEARGLVRIAAGEDRRTREVSLTALGWDAVMVGIPLWQQALVRIEKAIGEERRRTLLGNLSDVVRLAR